MKIQHFLIMDTTVSFSYLYLYCVLILKCYHHRVIALYALFVGSKMEVIVRGSATSVFNMLLTQGHTYTIHSVRFQTRNRFEFRNIDNHSECYFDNLTRVEAINMPIQFQFCPKHIASFDQVLHTHRNNFLFGKFCL